jgi:SAM-dependent methyltransferase
MDVKAHWDHVYATKSPDEVSWYQVRPEVSLQLIESTGVDHEARILDVGAGASRLIDELLSSGFEHVGALDVAEAALTLVKARLGAKADHVEWFAGDVTTFESPCSWDVWHDRAVFHFLVDSEAQQAYVRSLERSVIPGGYAIIATFGPQGPTRCSGLDVVRSSPTALAEVLGPTWDLITHSYEDHRTPSGAVQQFVYGLFHRTVSK